MSKEYKVSTLDDVAHDAGVSTATVSRCINSPSKLSEKTRDKVLSSIKKLQYTPNFGGQALAAQRTNTIGAVIPTMENAIFARGIQAFQERLIESNLALLLASSNYNQSQEFAQIKTLISRGAEGILLIGFERDLQVYKLLKARNIPYVIAWQYRPNSKKYCVGFNNQLAAYKLTSLVIENGHQNIGFIAGINKGNDRAALRVLGTKECIEKLLKKKTMPIVETKYSIEMGKQAFLKLIKENPNLSAIICGNDVLAAGAILQAKAMGLDVPNDISVVGFDDIDIAEIISPSLTTIHVPHRKMGIAAADIFVNIKNNQPNIKSVQLETNIVIRDSLKRI